MKATEYPDLTYHVYDPQGRLAERRPASLRYPRETELSILNAGYTIKINGKKVTKKELAKK